ncbi:MAG TPA: hypothetical protein DIW43_10475 [Spongiibacteraceae bacterium]|nr:hypothetical protein [Spongiibacteraceae bacterium]HCS27870.1 hypothetical protein [Spongiibacteraceae bacterium]|tara:strand:- start:7313 stop:7630 length:318 start_codon:yes stop_codon:yes gene_type:complete
MLTKTDRNRLLALAERDPKIARELEKIDQAQARLADVAARAKQQERKSDTREKVVIGAAVINFFLAKTGGREHMARAISAHITKAADRKFLVGRGWPLDHEKLEE